MTLIHRGNSFLRWMDKSVGRAALFFFLPFKRRTKKPESVEEVALLKLVGMGDLILLTAIVADLRTYYPQARLTVLCGPDNAALAPLIPHLDRYQILPAHPIKALLAIRGQKYDILIDCEQWMRWNALLTFFSKARYTLGFRTKKQQRHFLYSHAIAHRQDLHESGNFRQLIASLVPSPSQLPQLKYRKERRSLEEPYVVFHPWPSGVHNHLKRWPISHWIALARALAPLQQSLVITGSLADRPQATALIKAIQSYCPETPLHNRAGSQSLEETACLLHHARCVISVNTGIMHLAALTGTPLVALHGPTSIKRWGPLSKRALSLTAKEIPHGYLYLGFEYPSSKLFCMHTLSPREVLSALHSLCPELGSQLEK